MSRPSSTRRPSRRSLSVLLHDQLTIPIANRQLNAELIALQTLRNGERLVPGTVNAATIPILDNLIEHAEVALEEARDNRQLQWAEFADMRIVNRYINLLDGPDEMDDNFEDEEDSNSEDDLYGDPYPTDNEPEIQESSERSTLRSSTPTSSSGHSETAEEEFDPPFPSRAKPDIMTTRDNRFRRNIAMTRDEESIKATLERLGSLRRIRSNSQGAIENLVAARENAARMIRSFQKA
jgi:hypothetical protein